MKDTPTNGRQPNIAGHYLAQIYLFTTQVKEVTSVEPVNEKIFWIRLLP